MVTTAEDRRRDQRDYVLRTVEERGVRLIRLWFTDVLGRHKSVAISPAELEVVLDEGLQFDGSAIDGFSRIQESDVLARPDAATFELLPWADPEEPSGTIFCDITDLDGTPFKGDPRQVLRRNVDRARAAGFEMFCAPEVEFFYFADASTSSAPVPLDQASYFDLTTADVASDLRKQTLHMLEALSIPVEYSFHEDSPSQHEIDLQYTDALSMADSIMTLRLAVKKIAMDRGVYATFMPKPLNGVQGSGMHTHLSLFRDGVNAFHDPDAENGLSDTARAFIAGLLKHAREITAITNQLVNSYKRINEGYEAPRYVSWARNNRSALVRVPIPKPGKVDSTRVEYRAVDPACNPYLAFSVLLAAGLRGVEDGLELPPEARANLYDLSRGEQRDLGVAGLPANLSEALDEMEESTLVRDALGDHIFEWFLRNKRAEWSEYQRQVTPFELETYLPNW
ncbi:MAG: type I glutamate--ammonia ligase [Acidimicrobiales bacterium]|jgi:glutamine synthetase|uniref:Glutamine synthetase n=1 Tax=marine metagenome TaxID=408172 RepID=A0A381RDV9_9ZZZZ|nr:type I glutamate--ammonia ligase [Acidimicrobiales bacterium]MCS5671290.1 type I glutamate--ammonia ligase [Acidimicrobiales bacterium]